MLDVGLCGLDEGRFLKLIMMARKMARLIAMADNISATKLIR